MSADKPVHSTRGASGAYRWMNCAGAPAAEEKFEDTDSIYALEGTAAHKVVEACWQMDCEADAFLDSEVAVDRKDGGTETFTVDDDMVNSANDYLAAVKEYIKPGTTVESEVRLNLEPLTGRGDTYGTADNLVFDPETRHLLIADFKYGRGVVVEVEDNEQLLYYACGGVAKAEAAGWDVEDFTILIGQSRAAHPEGPIRRATYKTVTLLEFLERLNEALLKTDDPNAPRKAGKWCRFCRASGPTCPENTAYALAVAEADFAKADPEVLPAVTKPVPMRGPDGLPVVEQLTPDQVGWVLRRADVVENWIKRARAYGEREANAGRCPVGYKQVQKRTNRVIPAAKKEDVVQLLVGYGYPEEELHTPGKLLSPAQLETYLKRDKGTRKGGLREKVFEELAEYIEKPEGAWTLAPEESSKPSKEEVTTAGFTDETTKNEKDEKTDE